VTFSAQLIDLLESGTYWLSTRACAASLAGMTAARLLIP
jgi:hypothetical protein